MSASTYLEDLPATVRDRVLLQEGVLHISSDLKGNPDMIALVGSLRRIGILEHTFHAPSDFLEKYGAHTTRIVKGENELQAMALQLIARAHAVGASDIHITDNGSYVRIKFRILGMLCEDTQLEAATGRRMIRIIYDTLGQSANSPTFSPFERQDGRIARREYLPPGVHSVRIHSEPIECTQTTGDTGSVGTFMALRLLYDSTSAKGSLEERLSALGFTQKHSDTMDFLTRRTGLIVISGPTGHGKSTVLKHIMESMTATYPEKAFHSVEDPPEFPLRNVNQIMVSTKQDEDREKRAAAYINAIAGGMRSDPDIFMIGEIRYSEAAVSAIDAALTGHAVWATLHANNAFGIITRMESLLRTANFRDPLGALCDPNVLAGLEYQRLIPVLCPKCRQPFQELSADEQKNALHPMILSSLRQGGFEHEDIYGGLTPGGEHRDGIFLRGEGCEHCRKKGFVGQTVAAEVVMLDEELLSRLRQGHMAEAYRLWRANGNISYVGHARELIKAGLVDAEAATSRLGVPLNFDTFFEKGSKA